MIVEHEQALVYMLYRAPPLSLRDSGDQRAFFYLDGLTDRQEAIYGRQRCR
jgi:hypothetical protein